MLLDYALAERSFAHFCKAAWSVLEPTTQLRFNWHHECVAEHLEATWAPPGTVPEITRLIVNIPPRNMKSLMVTVMFPAWVWTRTPSFRFIAASFSESLATKHSVDRRLLIESQWYRSAWGNRFTLSHDQNQKTEFTNDKRGHMIAAGMLGTVTGKGGDYVIIDDPHNPKKAESQAERETTLNTFDSTFTTRLDDKKTGRMIIVMQRLHEKDLTGHVLSKEDGASWTHVKLPAEAPKRTVVTFPISGRKVVREAGELLHPQREGKAEIAAAKIALGSYGYAGQYDQTPAPRAGGIFKRHFWRFYSKLPARFDEVIQSWDLAFKDKETSDWVVGFVLGRLGADVYLIDRVRDRLGFVASCNAVKSLTQKHPNALSKLIEDKANGPGLVDQLKSTIPGLILVNPEGSKIERAYAVEPMLEAGNVWLPDKTIAPWIDEVIDECATFPKGENDDQVDALTQGLKRLQPRVFDRLNALGTL